ncbi:uncharacterized protein F5891DRAFT_974634 [Suillus fuscotomentosus]|uniref:Uncharacterized protein n=1 Tax=Suillus fuscotomentosus TaxID=1912939 RepID=A0AAD4HV80_9AGAM|nr:uncharacterized protein F5891DRAFT_974634 [Suillus fuscotomentosus]KAG1908054.1 hypothetical protein F5891DRAFT_974634 [Suillus fuscotomentosus]
MSKSDAGALSRHPLREPHWIRNGKDCKGNQGQTSIAGGYGSIYAGPTTTRRRTTDYEPGVQDSCSCASARTPTTPDPICPARAPRYTGMMGTVLVQGIARVEKDLLITRRGSVVAEGRETTTTGKMTGRTEHHPASEGRKGQHEGRAEQHHEGCARMCDAVTQHDSSSIIWWIELLTICQWWNGHDCEEIPRQNLYGERLWLSIGEDRLRRCARLPTASRRARTSRPP